MDWTHVDKDIGAGHYLGREEIRGIREGKHMPLAAHVLLIVSAYNYYIPCEYKHVPLISYTYQEICLHIYRGRSIGTRPLGRQGYGCRQGC